jgi:coronin-7
MASTYPRHSRVSNNKWFAIPWTTNGGSAIACVLLDKPKGRLPTKMPLVRGHREFVTAMSFNQFILDLLASGNAEGRILIQHLPEDGLTKDFPDTELFLQAPGKITRLEWHPHIPDILVSACTRPDDSHVVTFWNTTTAEAEREIEFFDGVVEDFSFWQDCRTFATTSKDNKIRIIDVVENRVLHSFEAPHQSVKETQLFLADARHVITIGFGERSKRSWSLWDFSGEDGVKEVCRHDFPFSNASLCPYFDVDNKLFYVGHFGIRSMDVFQLMIPQEPHYDLLQTVTFNSDLRGFHFFHKTTCDAKKVEIARCLRVAKADVVPISWTLPRRRKEFFQDDLYCPTMSAEPVMNASDFFEWDGTPFEAKMVDLNPGMPLLSQAPKEELTTRQIKYKNTLETLDKPNIAEEAADRKAEQLLKEGEDYSSAGNRWDATPMTKDEVDDAEWGSDLSD